MLFLHNSNRKYLNSNNKLNLQPHKVKLVLPSLLNNSNNNTVPTKVLLLLLQVLLPLLLLLRKVTR